MAQVIERLIRDFARLPGIGERTAERLVFFLLRDGRPLIREVIADLGAALETIHLCRSCQNFTESERCAICGDPRRRDDLLCVLEEPSAMWAIEKTGAYQGRYHILHGLLSPLDGIGPEELRIDSLLKRLEDGAVKEVVVATSTSTSGDATALYLARLLQPLGLKVTRLSTGMPVGSSLEYLDRMTLAKAIEHRIAL